MIIKKYNSKLEMEKLMKEAFDNILKDIPKEILEDVEDLNLEEAEDGFLQSNVSIVTNDDDLYFLLKVAENNPQYKFYCYSKSLNLFLDIPLAYIPKNALTASSCCLRGIIL